MRTAFFVNTLFLALLALAAVALANGSVEIPSGGSIGYAVEKSQTRLEIRNDAGTGRTILLKRDATVSADAVPIAIKVLGEVKGSAIILLDTYRSIPGGMSYCKAGKEVFLRVISTSKERLVQTVGLKVESCRDNLELISPGIEWSPESLTLKVHWLLGPGGKREPEARVIRLAPDGRPE